MTNYTAKCGCVYHAEEGVPCQHDIRLRETVKKVNQFVLEQEESRDADAGFDGGEFSGPAHDKILEEGINKIILDAGYSTIEEFYAEAGARSIFCSRWYPTDPDWCPTHGWTMPRCCPTIES